MDGPERPLSVCHLGKYYPPAPGGMENHVQTLARAQAELGVEVQVICVDHEAGPNRQHPVVQCDGPVKVLRVPPKWSLARCDWCPHLSRGLRDLNTFDLWHLHTPNPTMILALLGCRRIPPLVITHHSDIVKQKLLRWAFAPFERWIYGKARAILSTSPAYIDGSHLLQACRDRVSALPLGIDLEPFLHADADTEARVGRLMKSGEPIWLAVGRLVYYKGLHTAIEALREVPGRFVVIGAGPLRDDLQKQAQEIGVADRVQWLGQADQEQLRAAYRAATALWFPSCARSEGFGLVQVEAMASGCPVINTAIPGSGVTWVSPNEKTGLTVPIGDAGALARAAQRLLHEPGLRQRLADAARQRARDEFDHRLMARRSLTIYERVLCRAPQKVLVEA